MVVASTSTEFTGTASKRLTAESPMRALYESFVAMSWRSNQIVVAIKRGKYIEKSAMLAHTRLVVHRSPRPREPMHSTTASDSKSGIPASVYDQQAQEQTQDLCALLVRTLRAWEFEVLSIGQKLRNYSTLNCELVSARLRITMQQPSSLCPWA